MFRRWFALTSLPISFPLPCGRITSTSQRSSLPRRNGPSLPGPTHNRSPRQSPALQQLLLAAQLAGLVKPHHRTNAHTVDALVAATVTCNQLPAQSSTHTLPRRKVRRAHPRALRDVGELALAIVAEQSG